MVNLFCEKPPERMSTRYHFRYIQTIHLFYFPFVVTCLINFTADISVCPNNKLYSDGRS